MDQNSNIILEDNNYGVKTLIVQIQTICWNQRQNSRIYDQSLKI